MGVYLVHHPLHNFSPEVGGGRLQGNGRLQGTLQSYGSSTASFFSSSSFYKVDTFPKNLYCFLTDYIPIHFISQVGKHSLTAFSSEKSNSAGGNI